MSKRVRCVDCKRVMRPPFTKVQDFPDTVVRASEGRCLGCGHKHRHVKARMSLVLEQRDMSEDEVSVALLVARRCAGEAQQVLSMLGLGAAS